MYEFFEKFYYLFSFLGYMKFIMQYPDVLNKKCKQQHVHMNISCKNIKITNYLLN